MDNKSLDNTDAGVIDADHDYVTHLLKRRARLIKRKARYIELSVNAEQQIDALNFLITCATEGPEGVQWQPNTPPAKSAGIRATVHAPETEVRQRCGLATTEDILHCRTQREAARVIAQVNGGQIYLNEAAPVIKSAGLSKGLVNTIVASLHKFMTDSPDWIYVGPSRFELVADGKVSGDVTENGWALVNAGTVKNGV